MPNMGLCGTVSLARTGAVERSSTVPSLFDERVLARLKALALLSMTVDHVVRVAHLHDLTPWPEMVMFLAGGFGRLAFPLFVVLIGLRLAERPERWRGYARRLAAWTLVAQPAYVFAFGTPWWSLNVFASLLLVVLMVPVTNLAMRSDIPRTTIHLTVAVLIALALLLASAFVTFGIPGVLAGWGTVFALRWARCPSIVTTMCHVTGTACDAACPHVRSSADHRAQRMTMLTATCAGLICIIANLNYMESGVPMAAWGSLTALVVALSVAQTGPATTDIPATVRTTELTLRWPGWIFYAFYPAHLAALSAARHILW